MYLHGETVKDRQTDSDLVVSIAHGREKKSSLVIMPAVSGWVSASLPLLPGKLQDASCSLVLGSDGEQTKADQLTATLRKQRTVWMLGRLAPWRPLLEI
jgi:hypothetical protein